MSSKMSQIQVATCFASACLKPRVVMAGVPMRMPLVTEAGCGSSGTAFLLTVSVGAAQGGIGGTAGEVFIDEVEQHQVVLGATGDEFVTRARKTFGHRLGVVQHLFLVFGEGGVQRLQERDGFRGDDLHQRPALNAGEDGGVELFLNRFVGARENQPAARPAQVLWVVEVTTSAIGTGFGASPVATNPAMCAISTSRYAPTLSAMSRKRCKSSTCE